MATPFPNLWHLRTVGDTSSKACYVCYKPTTKVLITPDNKDFFYTCTTHLSDRGFVLPVVDEKAEAEKKRKEAMDREIEKVKQEYEEKKKKKKAKSKDKDDKDKNKKKKDDSDDEAEAEKDRDDKIKSIEAKNKPDSGIDDGPRIFILHRDFYQMRIDRIRSRETAKRNQQRMENPSFFPMVPKNDVT